MPACRNEPGIGFVGTVHPFARGLRCAAETDVSLPLLACDPHRQPLALQKMRAEDASRYDWAAMVMRLAPRLDSRRPHALAAVVVRSK